MSEPNQEPGLPVESEAPPAIPDLPAEPPRPTEDPLATRLVQLEYEALTLSHRAEELGQTIASLKLQVVVLGGVVVFLLLASGCLVMWVSPKVSQALAPKPPVEQPLPVITFAHWRQG
ncbi:MAG TPA: hypothetical protein VMB21_04495, partial [Candidatus Limnocylindria bacterium]|nr:hypothetical protein [Candidatus Limnocylindria bacterium]